MEIGVALAFAFFLWVVYYYTHTGQAHHNRAMHYASQGRLDMATQSFRKSAEKHYLPGMYDYGLICAHTRHYPEAFQFLREAAHGGHTLAQVKLATLLRNGEGSNLDAVEAMQWYNKAAIKCNAEAYVAIAEMYIQGEGVMQNNMTAVQWLERAIKLNHPKAYYIMAVLHFKGQGGIGQDYPKAFELYKKAIQWGYVPAAEHIAAMLRDGLGVTANPDEAKYWQKFADQHGKKTLDFHEKKVQVDVDSSGA